MPSNDHEHLEPNKILVVEDKFAGHWLYYVQHIVKNVPEAWKSVLLTSADVLNSSQFEQLGLGDCFDSILLGPQRIRWSNIRQIAEATEASNIVVPAADKYLIEALFARRPRALVSFLVMRSRPQQDLALLRRVLFLVVKVTCIFGLRLRGFRVLRLVSSLETPRSGRTVADPVSIDNVGGSSPLPGGVSWVSIIGRISTRKNVPLVADSVRLAQADEHDLGLVVAGQCEDQVVVQLAAVAEEFARVRIPLCVINRPLDESELNAIIVHSRAVVVAHGNEGPSGIVAKAVALGTPVVAAGAQALRADAERRPDSVLWSQLASEAIGANLIKAAALKPAQGENRTTARDFVRSLIGTVA